MPWSNPDYEHEMPPFNPEPIDDDPWDVPEAHPEPVEWPPDATERPVSDSQPEA